MAIAGGAWVPLARAAAQAVGCMVAKEFGAQAFAATTGRMQAALGRLARHELDTGRAAHARMTNALPQQRLALVESMMADFERLCTISRTTDTLMRALSDSAATMAAETLAVEAKLERHQKECWFAAWREVDVSEHVNRAAHEAAKLETNFELLTKLLPALALAATTSSAAGTAPHAAPNLGGAAACATTHAAPNLGGAAGGGGGCATVSCWSESSTFDAAGASAPSHTPLAALTPAPLVPTAKSTIEAAALPPTAK